MVTNKEFETDLEFYLMNPGDEVFFHTGFPTSDDMEFFTKIELGSETTQTAIPMRPVFYIDETTEYGCGRSDMDSLRGNTYSHISVLIGLVQVDQGPRYLFLIVECYINYLNENSKVNCSTPWSWSMYGRHKLNVYETCSKEDYVRGSRWLIDLQFVDDLEKKCPSKSAILQKMQKFCTSRIRRLDNIFFRMYRTLQQTKFQGNKTSISWRRS